MCGIASIFGSGISVSRLEAMVARQVHRGPDDRGIYVDDTGVIGLGHTRLSILDLSSAGHQPMATEDGSLRIVFNGEIYNYVELRAELSEFTFRSGTDTEVILAAYRKWGRACVDRFVGMFAFIVWDERERKLFAARDRFGVKPLFVHRSPQGGILASEIKAIHAAGVPAAPDPAAWATFLGSGMYDHGDRTFWSDIRRVPAGGWLEWSADGGWQQGIWYDAAQAVRIAGFDERPDEAVFEEALGLLEESVRLRFRSDVPVGICLSGGLDSSLLLALVDRLYGRDAAINAFTFYCSDPAYDETPWVRMMLKDSQHPWHMCLLDEPSVPDLARHIQRFQDEPYGGFPTLGMAAVHARARSVGVTVLLDGNGLDEAFAGYEYYQRTAEIDANAGPVQGSRSAPKTSAFLKEDFAALAESFVSPKVFGNPLRDLQYRDIRYAKIPRAMRFADRVSMTFSREVREPFLDHRIVELGLRQPENRKIRGGQGKWMLRQIARRLLPAEVGEAPKRAVQTPQREWLRGSLAGWADRCIEAGLEGWGRQWLDAAKVRAEWRAYRDSGGDNSFFIWQWISLGLLQEG